MIYDTLTYGGNEKSFLGWGFSLSSVNDLLRNQSDDVFTAAIAGANISVEADFPAFTFEQPIIVRINRTSTTGAVNSFTGGTISFQGKRVGTLSKANGSGMGVTYKFYGPWYDLSNTHYMQTFKGVSATAYLAPETILNTSTAVAAGQIQISVGDQVQAILQCLLDAYGAQGLSAPFQYIGRALHSGAIDLNVGASAGTPGGNYSFTGRLYNYAISAGNTIDTSLYSLFLHSYITKPLTCADALRKCLEFSPRVSVWFDYTTTPPTIHFTDMNLAGSQNLAIFDSVGHKSLDIQPRNDLVANAIRILFRITGSVGSTPVVDYSVDKYGPNGSNSASDPDYGLRVVNELVDLQGLQQKVDQGHLDLEPLAAIGGSQATKRAWWASKRGGEVSKLEDSRVRFQTASGAATTIPNAKFYYSSAGFDSVGAAVTANQEFTAADYSFYTYRLVQGTYHAWMAQGGTPILTVKCKAVTMMIYSEYDAVSTSGSPDTDRTGNGVWKSKTADHHVNLTLTNAVPDTGLGTSGYANFQVVSSTASGEGPITGIAQYIYNQVKQPQYEGEHVKVEAAFGTGINFGQSINFTGGATSWTTMNAQPQEIRRDYGRHETSVRIGPAKHLTIGQITSLLEMWRYRRPWYNPAFRSSNSIPAADVVDQAKSAAQANTTTGLENPGGLSFYDYGTPPSGSTPGVVTGQVQISAPALAGIDSLNS